MHILNLTSQQNISDKSLERWMRTFTSSVHYFIFKILTMMSRQNFSRIHYLGWNSRRERREKKKTQGSWILSWKKIWNCSGETKRGQEWLVVIFKWKLISVNFLKKSLSTVIQSSKNNRHLILTEQMNTYILWLKESKQ